MNNTTNPNNSDVPNLASGFTYGIIFTIGIIFLILVILFACARLRLPMIIFNRSSGQPATAAVHAQHFVEVTEQGLDDATLDSYPKLLYSDVIQKRDFNSSCCSICLVDYKETDELRMLPDCSHLYHLNCIDSWLKLHPTCPICRSSPVPASRSSAVTEEGAIPV